MNKGTVLVIGNSGVGKSTLINAVLGEEVAETGWGIKGTSSELKIYEGKYFRIVDTVGFEPDFFKCNRAIKSVKKWAKESVKDGNEERQINIIWFCVDGTAAKLFSSTIKNLSKATNMWKSVPIIAVITKSYSVPDRVKNIEMVNNAFAKQKQSKNLCKVVPVVADTYVLNDSAFAPPENIMQLIDITNEYMPAGMQASKQDIYAFKLSRKRVLSHGVVAAATISGVTVGAVPKAIPDAAILSLVEEAEIKAIARVYGIQQSKDSKEFFAAIVETGTVSAAAKGVIEFIQKIPGVNIAASILNAVIAGSIVCTIGEVSVCAFEQVYLGKKSLDDINWIKKEIENKLSDGVLQRAKKILCNLPKDADLKTVGKVFLNLLD